MTASETEASPPTTRRRWPFVVGAAVLVVVVAAVAVWYFVLRDTADPEADLDAIEAGGEGGEGPATPDGEWVVEAGDSVFAGYRVDELFAGETVSKTATGRTPAVSGTLTVEGEQVTAAEVTADLTQLASDQARRDSALATRGLETEQFPEATFALAEPLALPSPPERGAQVDVTVTGDLTLHGVTAPVEARIQAQWDGPTISVAGSAPIAFVDFGIDVIDIPGFVTTEDHGTVEFQLVYAPA